tara:strand:+ start:448 stop:630 length:183 start_codon:yes stop_codon:yes gene_type:complete
VIIGSTDSNKKNKAAIIIASITRSIIEIMNCPDAKDVSLTIVLINFEELLFTWKEYGFLR